MRAKGQKTYEDFFVLANELKLLINQLIIFHKNNGKFIYHGLLCFFLITSCNMKWNKSLNC